VGRVCMQLQIDLFVDIGWVGVYARGHFLLPDVDRGRFEFLRGLWVVVPLFKEGFGR
jgi:hypothetical protein